MPSTRRVSTEARASSGTVYSINSVNCAAHSTPVDRGRIHGTPGFSASSQSTSSANSDELDLEAARLAERFPLIGLSHASRTALLGLNAHAGLRRHQALSAEDVRTYKPDPAVYRLAGTVSGRPPERLLMVAAHAWDLPGARRLGLRTAYVARPVGDAPSSTHRCDLHTADLTDLTDRLTMPQGCPADHPVALPLAGALV